MESSIFIIQSLFLHVFISIEYLKQSQNKELLLSWNVLDLSGPFSSALLTWGFYLGGGNSDSNYKLTQVPTV